MARAPSLSCFEVRNSNNHTIQRVTSHNTNLYAAFCNARLVLKQAPDYGVVFKMPYRTEFNFKRNTSFTELSDWFYHGL